MRVVLALRPVATRDGVRRCVLQRPARAPLGRGQWRAAQHLPHVRRCGRDRHRTQSALSPRWREVRHVPLQVHSASVTCCFWRSELCGLASTQCAQPVRSRPESGYVLRGACLHRLVTSCNSRAYLRSGKDARDIEAQAQGASICRLVAGLRGQVVVWSLGRPGRDHSTLDLKACGGGQQGIVSALVCPPTGDLLAVGTFSRTIGIYDLRAAGAQSVLAGHSGGITHMLFSRCAERYVLCGVRPSMQGSCYHDTSQAQAHPLF